MHIYKFRMLSEDNEEFIRDFEIKGAQNFEDFHQVISDNVNLNGNELASFYICDQKWNKQIEITLINMEEPDAEDPPEEAVDTYVMSECRIRDFINEPHQRLLYEYDFLDVKTFYIELLSVFRQKDEDSYPRCSLMRGNLEQEITPEELEEEAEDLRNELLGDFDDLLGDRIGENIDFGSEFPEKDTDI
ncbi:MAG: hypothetical protein KDC05_00475 [Bacteroidales bacterium]|nr:hypothetical protein [Bacteroidales bacterium]